jgi:hypothetical protein
VYGDPGTPLTRRTSRGTYVLAKVDGQRKLLMQGSGASPTGAVLLQQPPQWPRLLAPWSSPGCAGHLPLLGPPPPPPPPPLPLSPSPSPSPSPLIFTDTISD